MHPFSQMGWIYEKMMKSRSLIRPAMIFIPFATGFLLPQAAQLQWTIRWALIVMLFLACLQIRFKQLKPKAFHWRVLAANLLIGVLPYWIFHAMGPEYDQLALAAFFVGITPTANAAPVVMAFLNGRVAYVLTGFVITNLFVSLSLFALIPMVTGQYTFAFAGKVAQSLFLVMGLPIVAAVLLRLFYPRAREWPAKLGNFSFSLWSFTLFVIAAVARTHFIENPDESPLLILGIAGVSLFLCAISFTTGYLIGPKRWKRECSQMLGQKNTTLTLYLALTYANPLVAMGPICYVLWHNSWNAFQMFAHEKKRESKKRKRSGQSGHARSKKHSGMHHAENQASVQHQKNADGHPPAATASSGLPGHPEHSEQKKKP